VRSGTFCASMVRHATILCSDVLTSIMAACVHGLSPRLQSAFWRKLRPVCRHFRNAVDVTLTNVEWKKALAKQAQDFCDDIGLDAGMDGILVLRNVDPLLVVRNAGIDRLLAESQYGILNEAMREFLPDEETQQMTIRRLMQHLCVPAEVGQFTTAFYETMHERLKARGAGLYICIVEAMRLYQTNCVIQTQGCQLLVYIEPPEKLSSELAVYIIGALAATMRHNMACSEVIQVCMPALECVVVAHFYDMRDKENVVDNLWVQGFNLPSLVVGVMRDNKGMGYELMHSCMKTLHVLLLWMRQTQHMTRLHTFPVDTVEMLVVENLSCHGHHRDLLHKSLEVYIEAVEWDFASMRQVDLVVQKAVNCLQQHIHDVPLADMVLQLFCAIIRRMQILKFDRKEIYTMQMVMGNSGTIPLHVVSINLQHDTSTREIMCHNLFKMLGIICQGNAHNVALVEKADVIPIIDGMLAHVPKNIRIWHEKRAGLVAVIANVAHLL